MAARFLEPGSNISPDQIFHIAKEKGYTQVHYLSINKDLSLSMNTGSDRPYVSARGDV